jgi:hypothetical protein
VVVLTGLEADRTELFFRDELMRILIGVLLAMFLVSLAGCGVSGARSAARVMQRSNDFKFVLLSLHNHHDTYQCFPPERKKEHFDENGQPYLSWRVHILPFIDHQPLYDQFKLDEPWDSAHNKLLLGRMPKIYKTTDDASKTTIMGFVSELQTTPTAALTLLVPSNGLRSGARIRDVLDGTSNTICIVDAAPEIAVPWTQPKDLAFDPQKPLPTLGRPNEQFVMVGFLDGTVKRLGKDIPEETWRALITRDGGEHIDFNSLR